MLLEITTNVILKNMTQDEVTFYIHPLEKNHLCSQQNVSPYEGSAFGNPNGFKGSTWARDLHLKDFFVDGISSRVFRL